MPRDGSGNYTLPVGNPVVTGTLITSAWANATMSDVAVQLNNVLTRDGILGPIGPFKLVDGAVATPGLAFNSEPGLGIFRSASGVISFAAVNGIPAALDSSTGTNTVLRLFPRGASGNSGITATNQPSGTANRTDLIVRMTATGSDITQVPTGTGTLLPQNYTAAKHVFLTDNTSTQDHFAITNTGASGVNVKLTGNGATTPNKYIRVLAGTLEYVNSAYSAVIASLTDAGTFTANNVGIFSDERLKYNITPAIGARARLNRLQGKLYQLKADQVEDEPNDKWYRGLIAQELAEVYPELVYVGHDGMYAVNYLGLISELIQAVNEIGVLDARA